MVWLNRIDLDELRDNYKEVENITTPKRVGPSNDHDLITALITNSTEHRFDLGLTVTFIAQLKEEFIELICTDSKKYQKLRKQLDENLNQSTTVIVSAISAYIADELGVQYGATTGLCAVLIYAAAKLGKETFCKSMASK